MYEKLSIVSTILIINNIFIISTVFSKTVAPSLPSLFSEAAIILEATTGKVFYQKNTRSQVYPASAKKIATAIFAIESVNFNDVVTVTQKEKVDNLPVTLISSRLGGNFRFFIFPPCSFFSLSNLPYGIFHLAY
ncbi:D-alanyl-D-alanine carboxypeptidase [Planococcus sp. ISL-110]|uniref:D-alanyl-D-alanine carboxypeptidase n=1 Tax=Planococcus sp. ISL-110 TaxID=2819167 RepID=UPI001BECBB6F|nr:D-alanyl-D-alanine carboxypeptidase [Planococcus sp. ISL-110]